MSLFYAICAGILVLAAIVLTVYLVTTLIQLRRTARSVEILSDNLNQEVARFQSVTASAADLLGAFSGTFGKTVAFALSVLSGFVKGFMKKKAAKAEGEEEPREDS